MFFLVFFFICFNIAYNEYFIMNLNTYICSCDTCDSALEIIGNLYAIFSTPQYPQHDECRRIMIFVMRGGQFDLAFNVERAGIWTHTNG